MLKCEVCGKLAKPLVKNKCKRCYMREYMKNRGDVKRWKRYKYGNS